MKCNGKIYEKSKNLVYELKDGKVLIKEYDVLDRLEFEVNI